jgi:S-sulfo-L-cysteine synthase (O-acetyl-L-serine-dependent)
VLINSILEQIGNTPLVRIRKAANDIPQVSSGAVSIYAKLEYMNPGGSVKDRAALSMVRKAIDEGQLRSGKTILDSTSGNTGIAYAMIGAALGYSVHLVMPSNVSVQRKQIIETFGAKITFSSPMEGSDGAILMARAILKDDPEKYFMPDQYNNEWNVQGHYETTGKEILEQTQGSITHFAATIGTSGTVMGTSRRLKEYNEKIACLAVMPAHSLHGLEGLKHMPSSIVPGIYHPEKLDGVIEIETEPSYDLVEKLARDEGLVVGYSSGGALLGAMEIAKKIDQGVIVTVFCDHGDRYFSERL